MGKSIETTLRDRQDCLRRWTVSLHQRLRLLISQSAPCQGVRHYFTGLWSCFPLRHAALEAGAPSSNSQVMQSETTWTPAASILTAPLLNPVHRTVSASGICWHCFGPGAPLQSRAVPWQRHRADASFAKLWCYASPV